MSERRRKMPKVPSIWAGVLKSLHTVVSWNGYAKRMAEVRFALLAVTCFTTILPGVTVDQIPMLCELVLPFLLRGLRYDS